VIVAGCHPEVEWITGGTPDGPLLLDEVYRGHEGVRRYFEDWVGAWDEYRVEPEEVIDTAADRVVVICRHGGRGKGSGVAIEQRVADVFTFRDGLAVRVQTVWDPADALAQVARSDSAPALSSPGGL
jgi:ketosteroid isomerase-like protein